MAVIEDFVQEKFGSSSPGSDRFKNDATELHASQVSDCRRKRYWKHHRNPQTDPSIYFELGRMFERLYGRALKSKYGEEQVKQDVEIEIHLGEGYTIVGESDWVVFEEGAPQLNKVKVREDGTRICIKEDDRHDIRSRLKDLRQDLNESGRVPGKVNDVIDKLLSHVGEPDDTQLTYDSQIQKVIETKTTRNLDWKKKYGYSEDHRYQLAVYQWAMDCPGEIVYIQRNDADEMVFEFDHEEDLDTDIEVRARMHFKNYVSEQLPPTTPMTDQECKYCDFKQECKEEGGSVWS